LTTRSLQTELRTRILLQLRSAYKHNMEEGLCSPNAWFILDQSVAQALDFCYQGLFDLEFLENFTEFGPLIGCGLSMPCIRNCTSLSVFDTVMTNYDAFLNFIDCHTDLLDTLKVLGESESYQMNVQIDGIQIELKKGIEHASELIDNEIRASFKEIMEPVNHRRSVYYILVQQSNFINEMLAEGEVDEKQAKFLLKELDQKIAKMKTSSLKIRQLTSIELLSGATDLITIFG